MKVPVTTSTFPISSSTTRQTLATRQNSTASTSDFSEAFRSFRSAADANAASSVPRVENKDMSVEENLAHIRAKGQVGRSQEDRDFLFANDRKLAEIVAKGQPFNSWTAEETNYAQTSGGFINTFANLSSTEKALYDKAVASGNLAAAQGIAQIALIRQAGDVAGGANGTTYNPRATEISSASVEGLFGHSIVDSTGNAMTAFKALAKFIQTNPIV